MSPRVTQKDVARLAGVSQATVSTVLNGGRAAVAAETQARIDAAIAQLGYRPNRFAQALRTQRSMVIACAVPDLTNPFYPAMVAGVQEIANTAEYDVVAINTRGELGMELGVLSGAAHGRYDGVVGVFFTLRAADFAEAITAGVAVVRIESRGKSGGALAIDDLYVDNHAAMREATDRLLDLGHRHIAMIAGRGGPQSVRVEGYRAALAARGIADSIWLDDSFTDAGGRAAVRQMLDAGERPTALVAANDLMALGAMQELAAAGLDVPADVSVVGFDDILAASLVTPRLSSVALWQERLGRTAAEMLLDRVQGRADGPGRARQMPYEIHMRASAGPPPEAPRAPTTSSHRQEEKR